MDQAEINNWKAIAESMAAKGDTESWFYLRARAIADGKPDPMPKSPAYLVRVRARPAHPPGGFDRSMHTFAGVRRHPYPPDDRPTPA